MNSKFKRWKDSDVHDLIEAFPLGLMVTEGRDGMAVTPLPMLPHLDEAGRLVRLEGHMALRNPRVEELRSDPRAHFIFLGPHGYVSPTLVSQRGWGPTWNYAVAWLETRVEFRPYDTHASLQHLVGHLEGEGPGCWSTSRMGERYEILAGRVVSFAAEVLKVDATFKLGQDEQPEVFEEIVRRLDGPDLASWMRRFRVREK